MILFDLEIMIMISNMISFVNRMSWRWKDGEGGETGTRGGAGAAAGEKWRVLTIFLVVVQDTCLNRASFRGRRSRSRDRSGRY